MMVERSLGLALPTDGTQCNESVARAAVSQAIEENGRIDAITLDAITTFQKLKVANDPRSGLVVPNGPTLTTLRDGMPKNFIPAKLQGIMIRASPPIIQIYFAPLVAAMNAKRDQHTASHCTFLGANRARERPAPSHD
jgi:hypothetical protein